MILIIGPAFSGKREYARKVLNKLCGTQQDVLEEVREQDALKEVREQDALKEVQEPDILCEVQELVTEEMNEAKLQQLAASLVERAQILTASETGAGIVPMESGLRKVRERQGKLLAMLAARAECVIRVYYGIPEMLKGNVFP